VRRRALLSTAAAAGTAALSGCLTGVRQTLSGDVRFGNAGGTLHTDQWVAGGLAPDSEAWYHAALYAEAPPRDADLFTDAYPRRETSFDNDLLNDGYENGFVLLFEARMAPEDAFVTLPAHSRDPAWTGWDSLDLPLQRSRHDPETLDEDQRRADFLVSTMLAYYESEYDPARATVAVYDDEGNQRGGSVEVRARSER
jgi:hypothetical protein